MSQFLAVKNLCKVKEGRGVCILANIRSPELQFAKQRCCIPTTYAQMGCYNLKKHCDTVSKRGGEKGGVLLSHRRRGRLSTCGYSICIWSLQILKYFVDIKYKSHTLIFRGEKIMQNSRGKMRMHSCEYSENASHLNINYKKPLWGVLYTFSHHKYAESFA